MAPCPQSGAHDVFISCQRGSVRQFRRRANTRCARRAAVGAVSAVLAGRAWCGLLCPMGAATEWMSRIGLNRAIPAWLKWSGLPLASFVVISLLNEATGTDDDPVALAILFGSLLFVAITVGFLFGRDKRAWCRHACPIGMTLGLSARLSGVSFEPKRQRAGGEHYTEKTVCPTMIDLKRKTETRHRHRRRRPRSAGRRLITLWAAAHATCRTFATTLRPGARNPRRICGRPPSVLISAALGMNYASRTVWLPLCWCAPASARMGLGFPAG